MSRSPPRSQLIVKTPEQASHLEWGEKTLQSPSPKFNISFTMDVLSCFQFQWFLVYVYSGPIHPNVINRSVLSSLSEVIYLKHLRWSCSWRTRPDGWTTHELYTDASYADASYTEASWCRCILWTYCWRTRPDGWTTRVWVEEPPFSPSFDGLRWRCFTLNIHWYFIFSYYFG